MNLKDWLAANLAQELKKPPLKDDSATLQQLMQQDLEPDPGGGGMKIRSGVAEDRRVLHRSPEVTHFRSCEVAQPEIGIRVLAADV